MCAFPAASLDVASLQNTVKDLPTDSIAAALRRRGVLPSQPKKTSAPSGPAAGAKSRLATLMNEKEDNPVTQRVTSMNRDAMFAKIIQTVHAFARKPAATTVLQRPEKLESPVAHRFFPNRPLSAQPVSSFHFDEHDAKILAGEAPDVPLPLSESIAAASRPPAQSSIRGER